MLKNRGKDIDYRKWMLGIIVCVSVAKAVIMALFSSDYQNKMFMPFVECFLAGNRNPYQYYYENHLLSSFPYPPLMLWIESLGGIAVRWMEGADVWLRNFIFKLPLLVCDLLSLYYLVKICGRRRKYILILYFCSPIILYSTYMHGQLDIVPTTFLIISIYYLLRRQEGDIVRFSIALMAALSCKFHILAVVPLLYWYLYRKRGLKVCILSATAVCAGVALICAPYFSEGFVEYVIFNREQTTLVNVFLDYGSVKLYLPILALIIIYLKLIQLNNINRELLLCSAGIIFAVFLICVPPMPGWFVWMVPFALIYFVEVNENRYKVLMQYAVFCFLYLFYFIFWHKTLYVDLYFGNQSMAFLKAGNESVRNIVFTALTATLILIVISMYQFGIQKNAVYKRNNCPFTLGIAGDSGTGKTELLSHIELLLDPKKILYIEGDGDHRWERGSKNWEQYTHLEPKANYLYRQAKDLQILRTGNAVKRKEYDHDSGRFTQEHRINPKPYIIMCGLHSLYLPQMRKALDLKIYLDTDETLRRFWKIRRDVDKRGYSNHSIIEQIEKRIPDAEKYIYPQKQYADLVIQYFDETLTDCFDLSHELELSLKITAKISLYLEDVVEILERYGVSVLHEYDEDMQHQTLIFSGKQMKNMNIDFAEIAREKIEQFDDIFPVNMCWKAGVEGMVQLFILIAIGEKVTGN